jgi:hypothetical protein
LCRLQSLIREFFIGQLRSGDDFTGRRVQDVQQLTVAGKPLATDELVVDVDAVLLRLND